MKLLIVDVHAGIRALIRELLCQQASQIYECSSAEDAIALCADFQPDCITMDFKMTGMDGLTALSKLRALCPGTHLIMVTQFDYPTMQHRARQAGADHFVLKEKLSELHEYIKLLRVRIEAN